MQLRISLLTILSLLSLYLQAQQPSYPKYYFRNPLSIPMKLAANFGELRPNHWHMGLDIRTNQKENLPVYAAADGYIAHVGVRSQSFGRYIIINHPNGFSTLYAHLNDFFPALEQDVTQQQYKEETWAIELDFSKEKFPVLKNQFIAYSGNTGGSQGPHLHFEIRDTKTSKCLNPLLFGLPVQDNVPPSLVKLAIYDRNNSVYEQRPLFFSVKNTNNGYIIPNRAVIKTEFNKISFALQAYDRTSGSANPNGIYSAQLFFDEKPQISFTLDSIGYNETRYINAQIDYKYHYDGGSFLQHLSQLSGDHGVVYKKMGSDGTINLQDTDVHFIHIEIKDAYLNTSQLNFAIQYNGSLAKTGTPAPVTYQDPLQRFAPNNVNVLEKPDFEMYLPEYCLYDTIQAVYFRSNSTLQYAVTALHQVNDASIPVHGELTIRIKPNKPVPAAWKDKIVIQCNYRNSNGVRKAEWQGNNSADAQWLSAEFSDFGAYQAFADTIPPEINKPGNYRLGKHGHPANGSDTIDLSQATRIIFQPTDNFRTIKNFRAELNGQWLRFINDKNWSYIYIFDNRCPYGVHELKVKIEDLAGNVTIKRWWFKRYPYTPSKKKAGKKKGGVKKRGTNSTRKLSKKKKK
jgi:murein DD-endopeptidase MepM/ murein hydrolase activator NlpD